MRDPVIRGLEVKDYKNLIELWEKAGLPYKPKGRDSLENIKRQLKRENTLYLVAELNGEIIGSVLATHDSRKGWINRLSVLPSFQGKRVAKKLVEEAERWLYENDIEIVACLIEDWNVRSMKFFEKMGYIKHEDIFYFTKRKNPDV